MLTPRTTSRTLPGGIRVNSETRTVNVTLLPFIRSRKIFFKIEGLLPNTKHRPLFDGVDVSAWCREETFTRVGALDAALENPNSSTLSGHPETASNLISDSNGVIEGSFYVPNTPSLRFRAGRREFKVRDWDATSDSAALSKAYAAYTAQGTLETRQTSTTTILPAPPIPPRYIDPVAQSFQIEKASGAFVTGIDVFFRSKSSTIPVRCQLRTMENGLPTQNVVPGADVYVFPADVNVSVSPSVNDASSKTKFEFDTPIYLEGFREYAIVIMAESTDYEVWTAVTTEYVVGSTEKRITKQPALGSFFKSQNGSTWTPDQSRDLMFQVYRADFTAGGTAYFENPSTPAVSLASNPFTITEVATNPTVRVRHKNHGFSQGSRVTFAGATGFGGLTAGQLNTVHNVTDSSDIDSYTIEVTGTSTSTGAGGGSAVTATDHMAYDIMFPNVNEFTVAQTAVGWSAKYVTGESPVGLETPYQRTGWTTMGINENNVFEVPYMVANEVNEDQSLSGVRSLQWRALLATNNSYVSPMVDLSRLSANLVRNRIDNQAASAATGFNVPAEFTAETDAQFGTSVSKHVTIPVNLDEPAIGLKVIFAANRPSNSYIDLYYRVTQVGADTNLSETDWTLAPIEDEVPTDDDPNIFREYRYNIPEDDSDLEPFDTYQFKIVFRSQSTSLVPRIKDLRGIALAT